MERDTLVANVAAAMLADGVRINKLDPNADETRKAKAMEEAFTRGVEFLRSVFPNEHVRKIASLIWDTVGGGRVPVCLGPDVPSLSLAMIGQRDSTGEYTKGRAAILLPHNWLDRIANDPLMQMGAILFVGSQAVDFVHGRLHHGAADRGRAYEAEYLRTIQKKVPAWTPTKYQTDVLRDFPEGLASVRVKPLLYTLKPIEKVN